jgi:flagellar biosynthetic protein FliS
MPIRNDSTSSSAKTGRTEAGAEEGRNLEPSNSTDSSYSGDSGHYGARVFDLSNRYGSQVNQELSILTTALFETAASQGIELHEGDLDAFCQERQKKLTVYTLKNVDEKFDRLRKLNMLFEACLAFIDSAHEQIEASSLEDFAESIEKAQKIIQHLSDTLDRKNGGELSAEIAKRYEQISIELQKALENTTGTKLPDAYDELEKIYLGYLELEIRKSAVRYLRTRDIAA